MTPFKVELIIKTTLRNIPIPNRYHQGKNDLKKFHNKLLLFKNT